MLDFQLTKILGIAPEFKFTALIATTHEFESWKIMLIVVDSHKIHWTSPMLDTNYDEKIYCA